MTDWFKEVTAARAAPPSASKTDWYQELTSGPGPSKAGANKPLILDRLDLAAPNTVIARASLATDAETQIKRYAEHFNAPTNYFGVVDGEVVRWVPEAGAYARVVPSVSGQSGFGNTALAAISQTAAASGEAIPQIAGMAAGIVAGPTGTSLVKVPFAAALTDWARQALDRVLAGEEAIPFAGQDYNYGSMARQGLTAGAGQAIAVGVNRLLTRNPIGVDPYDRLKAMDTADHAKWQAIEAEAEKRGVHLSAGQKTGLRSLMAKERQLSRWDETMDMVHSFKDRQWRGEIPAAYYDEISKTAPVMGREDMIQSFRAGADDVVQQAVRARAEQARVAYGAAYEKFPVLDSPILRDIWSRDATKKAVNVAREIADARGDLLGPVDAELTMFAREAAALGKIEKPTGGVARGLTLETWDRLKRAIDPLWQAEINQATGQLSAKGVAYKKLKNDLVAELDRLTGGPNGAYAQARALYGEGSEVVDQVLEGGVGFIQKMQGPDRVNMVTRVFNGRNVLPEEIARMRKLFEKSGNLDAWNSGLVAHLSNTMDDVLKSAGMGGNVPGKLYSTLGRDALQHDAVIAAMGKEQGKSFEKFLEVLHASARSLPEGSPTATDLGAAAGELSKTTKVIGNLFSPSSYWDAGNKFIAGIEAIREPGARIKLAEYLLGDEGMKELAKFKMLSPGQQKTVVALSQIFTNAGIVAAGSLTGIGRPDDFLPALEETQ